MTTTPTSGAADLPEALRLAAAISNLLCSNEAAARTLAAAADELVRLHAESEMRRAALLDEMQKAALAAGQATAAQAVVPANMRLCYSCGHPADAHPWVNDPRGGKRRGDCPAAPAQPAAQQGVAYAALPDLSDADGEIWRAIIYWGHAKRGEDALRKASELERVLSDQMRAFADATHTLRASHGQAPASVLHLVHSAFAEIAMAFPKAFALHKVGIADTAVRKALAAPAPPPECETEAEKRAFAFGWFKALESERVKADNKKKDPL